MMTIRKWLVCCALFLAGGCAKDDLTPPASTPATPTTPTTPTTPGTLPGATGLTSETTTGIFFTSRETNASGTLFTVLYCFNPNLTLRWKKVLPNSGLPKCFMENGKVFLAQGIFVPPASNYTDLYAFDATTGNTVWSRLILPESLQNPFVRNDTIFTGRTLGTINSTAAYSALNGALLWNKPNADVYPAFKLTPDGNFVYFLGAGSSNTSARFACFNTVTQQLGWEINQFTGFSSSVSEPVFTASRLGLVLGNSSGSTLLTFNKLTGAAGFTKSANFGIPATTANRFFVADEYQGLVALNDQTGTSEWQTDLGGRTYITGEPYISGDNLYVIGQNFSENNTYIFSAKTSTGALSYRKRIGPPAFGNVVVGQNIYSVVKPLGGQTPIDVKLLVFDAATGTAKDSVSITVASFGDIGQVGVAGSSGKLYFGHSY